MHIYQGRIKSSLNFNHTKKLNAMKKSIVGMLALATMVVGMSAFKSADVAAVKSVDSTATMVDSLVRLDSMKVYGLDSLQSLDSLQGRLDSMKVYGLDSLQSLDSLKGTDSLMRFDSLQRVDSLQGLDSLKSVAVEGGSITGKITPADGATEVEAVNGADKLKGAVSQGAFTIPAAKAGTYTITILGKSPFKNAVIKDVKVEDGKATDLGEVKLEQ
jgi:TolA-binding protein